MTVLLVNPRPLASGGGWNWCGNIHAAALFPLVYKTGPVVSPFILAGRRLARDISSENSGDYCGHITYLCIQIDQTGDVKKMTDLQIPPVKPKCPNGTGRISDHNPYSHRLCCDYSSRRRGWSPRCEVWIKLVSQHSWFGKPEVRKCLPTSLGPSRGKNCSRSEGPGTRW